MIKPLQPGFRPRKNKQTGLRPRECVSFFGDERSKPMTRMLIMPYGTESKSRNADFISIAAERQSATLGLKGRQT